MCVGTREGDSYKERVNLGTCSGPKFYQQFISFFHTVEAEKYFPFETSKQPCTVDVAAPNWLSVMQISRLSQSSTATRAATTATATRLSQNATPNTRINH